MLKMLQRLIDARQASVNKKVAVILQRSEFKHETVDYVEDMIKKGKLHGRLNQLNQIRS